ncbi:MAG: transglycosylase SLT domain-containing protein [Acidobacteriota bacterium]|nr:transglycosylase SLT domain-containing protein [Acidobacteriota bacterium]
MLLSSCTPVKDDAESTLPASDAVAPELAAPAPAPAVPAAEPQPPQHSAPLPAAQAAPETVELAIARAETEYARGKANYEAGHLEAAKENFDAAFNILLRAPSGVQSDDRLQHEFDRIVDATNELEMEALKQGDGFTEQHYEPAPIDEANNITFPVDPNIRAKAQQQLANTHSDLPLMLTDPVVSYINYFSSRGHGTIAHALIRRGRYLDMISRVFREEGVPQDLVFLAQAESGFQPLALSRAGARGMWQFMPFDGLKAGLQRNWWMDERQDPEKSTRAAARLLRDLYAQFGDWYLAMAAYNSGPGTVQRAVQRTGYADFWELYKRNVLPGETRNYVPIILAMTIMAKNPTQYGLDHLALDAPIAYDTVRIHYPIDLRLVAECTDSSTAALAELNPSLLRMTTPKDTDYDLRLPQGTVEMYEKNVAAIPADMRVSWRYHRVEDNESLAEVARRYHTTAAAIAEANNLEEDAKLERDTRLIIPVSASRASAVGRPSMSGAASSSAPGYSKKAVRYKVRKGDTVLSVADDYGVPVEKVRQWNHLSGNSLKAGRTLTLYRPLTAASAGTEKSSGGKKSARSGEKNRASAKSGEAEEKSAGKGAEKSADGKKATGKKKSSRELKAEAKESKAGESKSREHKARGAKPESSEPEAGKKTGVKGKSHTAEKPEAKSEEKKTGKAAKSGEKKSPEKDADKTPSRHKKHK